MKREELEARLEEVEKIIESKFGPRWTCWECEQSFLAEIEKPAAEKKVSVTETVRQLSAILGGGHPVGPTRLFICVSCYKTRSKAMEGWEPLEEAKS